MLLFLLFDVIVVIIWWFVSLNRKYLVQEVIGLQGNLQSNLEPLPAWDGSTPSSSAMFLSFRIQSVANSRGADSETDTSPPPRSSLQCLHLLCSSAYSFFYPAVPLLSLFHSGAAELPAELSFDPCDALCFALNGDVTGSRLMIICTLFFDWSCCEPPWGPFCRPKHGI